MNPDERNHLEQLVGVYTGNIRHLEKQVALRGGSSKVELELYNSLKEQRAELAAVRRRLTRSTKVIARRPLDMLSAYLPEPSLSRRERMMVTLLLDLLDASGES